MLPSERWSWMHFGPTWNSCKLRGLQQRMQNLQTKRPKKPQWQRQRRSIPRHHPGSRSRTCSQGTMWQSKVTFQTSGAGWNRGSMAWMARLPKLDSKGDTINHDQLDQSDVSCEKVHGPRDDRGAGRSSSPRGSQGLPCGAGGAGEKGILSLPKPWDPDVTSEEPGVAWKKRRKRWEVMIRRYRRGSMKYIYGGTFAEKAVGQSLGASGKPWAAAPGEARGRLVVAPSVPYPGVKLNQVPSKGPWHGVLLCSPSPASSSMTWDEGRRRRRTRRRGRL